MLKRHRINHAPAIAIGALALGVAAAGGAYASGDTGTITVCVHHHGGTLYRAKRCSRHDSKLVWSIQGPQGIPGLSGASGTNGAVAGFAASQTRSTDFTSTTSASPATLLTKQLPAGSFVVSGKVVLLATGSSTSEAGADLCSLTDNSTSDVAGWGGPLENLGTGAPVLEAVGTVSMDIAVSSSSPSTVTINCYDAVASPPADFHTYADYDQIDAIQTSSNS